MPSDSARWCQKSHVSNVTPRILSRNVPWWPQYLWFFACTPPNIIWITSFYDERLAVRPYNVMYHRFLYYTWVVKPWTRRYLQRLSTTSSTFYISCQCKFWFSDASGWPGTATPDNHNLLTYLVPQLKILGFGDGFANFEFGRKKKKKGSVTYSNLMISKPREFRRLLLYEPGT